MRCERESAWDPHCNYHTWQVGQHQRESIWLNMDKWYKGGNPDRREGRNIFLIEKENLLEGVRIYACD